MRKLLCTVLSVVMVLAASVCGFGAVNPEEEGVKPQYVTTDSVDSRVGISNGTASYYARFEPKTGSSISYEKATLKLVNSAGTVIKTKNDTIYKEGGYFKISDSKTLSSRGIYHAEYTLKVYKSGNLVETIKGQSVSATY